MQGKWGKLNSCSKINLRISRIIALYSLPERQSYLFSAPSQPTSSRIHSDLSKADLSALVALISVAVRSRASTVRCGSWLATQNFLEPTAQSFRRYADSLILLTARVLCQQTSLDNSAKHLTRGIPDLRLQMAGSLTAFEP